MAKRRISSGTSFEAVVGYSRAATAVICGLVDERMRIEIEVTARKGA